MSLHNPQNLKLPPLEYDKKSDRITIENDKHVQGLISSKLLLNKDLNRLLAELFGYTKEINSLLEKKDDYIDLSRALHEKSGDRINYFRLERHFLPRFSHVTSRNSSEFKKEYEKALFNERKKLNQKLINKINKISNQIQSELDFFEKKHRVDLDILENINLYCCKGCKKILFFGRFHAATCVCGKNISTNTSYEPVIVQRFGTSVIKFIESNIWLEFGIDLLFKRKEFDTMCGVNILGHSGIYHEIDNFAEKKSEQLRIFCECKNTDVNVNDIFIFAGKMQDIGCTRGYIFTTSFGVKNDVMHLARSKNITVVEQVLEKDEKKIIKEIKEGPQF